MTDRRTEIETEAMRIVDNWRSEADPVGALEALQKVAPQWGAPMGAFGANRKGRPIPWGEFPARPFIGFSSEDELMIEETLDAWLQRATDQ